MKTEAVENPQKLANKFLIGLNSMTEGKPLDQSQLSRFYQNRRFRLAIHQKMRELNEMKKFLTNEPPFKDFYYKEILDRLESHAFIC